MVDPLCLIVQPRVISNFREKWKKKIPCTIESIPRKRNSLHPPTQRLRIQWESAMREERFPSLNPERNWKIMQNSINKLRNYWIAKSAPRPKMGRGYAYDMYYYYYYYCCCRYFFPAFSYFRGSGGLRASRICLPGVFILPRFSLCAAPFWWIFTLCAQVWRQNSWLPLCRRFALRWRYTTVM